MALVNLSQAARMANISRPHLYRRYIKTGKMTIDRSDPKGPMVDTSELLRLFGELNEDTGNSVTTGSCLHETTPAITSGNNPLQPEVAALRERLQDAHDQLQSAKDRDRAHQDRERWLQGQVDKLTDTIKLLEHRPTVAPVAVALPAEDPAGFAKVAELAVKLQEQTAIIEAERIRAQELESQLAAERSRGFLSRLFGGKR